jgi:hypothetical protein
VGHVKLHQDSILPFDDIDLSDGRRLVRIEVPATGYAVEEAIETFSWLMPKGGLFGGLRTMNASTVMIRLSVLMWVRMV